ncbi:MAG: hypothetical protein JWM11_549 [Planctomycetaceae bacterium]|nr:hypothetical protein [Planctomycetaceae bacterium]
MSTNLEQELSKLKYGDHICSIYENADEQLDAAVQFIKEGINQKARCLYIADEHTIKEVAETLSAAGVNVDQELLRGALRLQTSQDTYLRTGNFVPQVMTDFVHEAEVEALAAGFSGLRLVGEMTWALQADSICDRLIEYEALFNHLLKSSKSVVLCQYNKSRFDSPCIHDVIRTHPLVILDDQVFLNPYYESPEILLMQDHAGTTPEFKKRRVDWWISQLKRASTAEQEREHALEKLKQSERRFAEAQQVAHIGSWERDLRTNEVTWSDELYRIFGAKADEVDLSYRQFLKFLVPDDVERIRATVEEAIRDRRNFSCDYRITLADGSTRVLHDRGGVILNEQGEPIRLVGTAQDVTGLRRVEEMLEENRRRSHAIFENALDPIFLFDQSGRYVEGNPAACKLLGYSRDELVQLTIWDVTPVETRQRIHQLLELLLSDGSLSGEITVLCKSGTTREVEFRSVANILPGLHLCAHRDITERKRAEEALRESADRLQTLSHRLLEVQEEERRHLARELHDEFGQILATITLHLHAARGLAGPDAVPHLNECSSLLREAGKQVRSLALELRPTMLDSFGLETSLRWLAEQHQQRGGCAVHIVGHLPLEPLAPKLAIACFRVVQEALTNVMRHAAASNVWIELSQSESILKLVVRDDGVGFDVIRTQGQSTRRGGLGLLGMAERVQILGGSLVVESEPGSHTHICASFPINNARQESADAEE